MTLLKSYPILECLVYTSKVELVMKILKVFCLVIILFGSTSCKKNDYDDYTYEFVKPYCTEVLVGGIVGVMEKCYSTGDQIKGNKVKDGSVAIRIAGKGKLNDTSSSANYQEILKVPYINLKIVDKN
jgi:hypothetical protein